MSFPIFNQFLLLEIDWDPEEDEKLHETLWINIKFLKLEEKFLKSCFLAWKIICLNKYRDKYSRKTFWYSTRNFLKNPKSLHDDSRTAQPVWSRMYGGDKSVKGAFISATLNCVVNWDIWPFCLIMTMQLKAI